MWKASSGTQFRIDDDGQALAINLVSGNAIQSLKGKLMRRDRRSFAGDLDVVFNADLTKRYSVDMSATVTDPRHLHLHSTNWPSWDRTGKYTGKTTLDEVWTRIADGFVNPFDP